MDPLSIATAASSLVFCVVRSGKALAGIYGKYQDAQRCVFMMQTECTVLAAALSQLQMRFSTTASSSRSAATSHGYPDFVVEAIDLSLVGCTLTLSVLSKEIESLTAADSGGGGGGRLARGKKIQYLWKEDAMNELLQQLRGQSAALNLLLRALDSSSIDQILSILRSGGDTFHQVRRGAASIREAHPHEHYAESILDMKFDDTQTLYSLDDDKALHRDDSDEDEITSGLGAVTGLGSDRNTPNLQPASSAGVGPFGRGGGEGGLKTHYNAKHDLWCTIDPHTGEVRYLPRGSPTSPPATEPLQPKPALGRKPVPVPAAESSRPKHVTPGTTTQNAQPAREPTQPPPRPSPAPGQPMDFAPWKMNTDAKFRTALENLRREKTAPAMAVGIVSADGRPPNVQVVGYRRQGCATAVTRADCFAVANSNVFTTTALGVLVERGLFRWDETVLDLFPALASRVHPFHHQTTLAMLGAHLSGFGAYITGVEEGELFDYIRHGGASVEQQRLAVAMSYLGRPPDKTPGRTGGYAWNWANPILIAAAMEQRTGVPLESLVKSLVFDPLEMYSAGFAGRASDADSHPSNDPTHPCGHSADTRQPLDPAHHVFHRGAFSASTGISCSAPDYAAFVGMHLRAAMGVPTAVLLHGGGEGTTTPPPPAAKEKSFFHTKLVPEQISTPGGWITATRDWAGAAEAVWLDGRCDGWACTTWIAPATGKAYFALVSVEGDPGVKIADDAVSLVIRHATR